MEHLVNGPIQCLPRVPFIGGESYDSEGFHGFPQRAGWYLNTDGRWLSTNRARSKDRDGPLGPIAAFLQAWLFFGLLTEVLGAEHFDAVEFREHDDHGKWYITTKPLPRYLSEWRDRERNAQSKAKQNERMLRAQLALDEAWELVSTYCSVSSARGDPKWEIHELLSLSFMVLGETLSNAKAVILKELRLKAHGWHNTRSRGWGNSKAVLRQLELDKWCPRTVHVLRGLLGHNESGLVYALHISHAKAISLDHRNCTIEECIARTADIRKRCLKTYLQPGQNCNCDLVDTNHNMPEIIQIIKKGGIALLRYDPDSARVDVIEYTSGMRYIILSHVWADGFGDLSNSKLPVCRLNEFKSVFDRIANSGRASLAGNPTERSDSNIPFWIDTLAIPTGDQYKSERREAIKKMHQIYRNASYTVVLDAGLMSQNSGGTYQETAMKIASSHWMTRLWTLQEAYLSNHICFCFSDDLVDMDTLERIHRYELNSAVPAAAGNYYTALLGPERLRLLSRNQVVISPELLVSVWKAVQWRTTHHRKHETLALATLLELETHHFDDLSTDDLDSNAAAEIGLDQKMTHLLQQISRNSTQGIPAGLIFLPSDRIPIDGYRWAPRSWMTGEVFHDLDPFGEPPVGAQLTESGLLVRYPGFMLHTSASSELFNLKEVAFPTDKSLLNWLKFSNADDSADFELREDDSFAIITPDAHVVPWRKIALLVLVDRVQNDAIYAQIVKRIWIQCETRPRQIIGLRKKFQSSTTSVLFGEALIPDRQWYIDGMSHRRKMEQSRASTKSPSILSRISNKMKQLVSFQDLWEVPRK